MAEVEQKLTQFTYEYEKSYQKYYSYFWVTSFSISIYVLILIPNAYALHMRCVYILKTADVSLILPIIFQIGDSKLEQLLPTVIFDNALHWNIDGFG